MKALWRSLGALVAVGVCAATLSGCLPCDEANDTCGGGGGGGGGSFTQGFAFVRSSDNNIYVADKADYERRRTQLADTGDVRHPSLSRDGKNVVFSRGTGTSGTDIAVAPTSGASAPSVLIASDSVKKNFRFPVFSPDGKKVVFTYDRGISSYLGVVNASGGGFEELGSGTLSLGAASFYPDGVNVLASAGSNGVYDQLVKVNITTRSIVDITNNLGSVERIENRAMLSPDGTKVALDGRVSGGGTRIFVADLAQTSLSFHQIDDPGEAGIRDVFPTWLDNGQVAFSSDAGGGDNVYVLPASSRKASLVLVLAGGREPSYASN